VWEGTARPDAPRTGLACHRALTWFRKVCKEPLGCIAKFLPRTGPLFFQLHAEGLEDFYEQRKSNSLSQTVVQALEFFRDRDSVLSWDNDILCPAAGRHFENVPK
jgi:hypothetical protein